MGGAFRAVWAGPPFWPAPQRLLDTLDAYVMAPCSFLRFPGLRRSREPLFARKLLVLEERRGARRCDGGERAVTGARRVPVGLRVCRAGDVGVGGRGWAPRLLVCRA